MAVGLELGKVGVTLRVIDELVVGEVLEPIVVDACEEREHAEQVGGEVIEDDTLRFEVLDSTDRKVERVRITAVEPKQLKLI